MTERLAEIHEVLSGLTEADREDLAWVAGPEISGERIREAMLTPDGIVVATEQRREIFSLTGPRIGTVQFDVRGIKDAILAGRIEHSVYEATLNQEWVDYVVRNGGVEEPHIARVKGRHLRRPGVMLLWPDGRNSLIDGNHRLVARWRAGRKTFTFVMVPVTEALLPYMARPGEEEKFFPHKDTDGLTTISRSFHWLGE